MRIDSSSLVEMNMLQMNRTKANRVNDLKTRIDTGNKHPDTYQDGKLKEVCNDFQAILIKQMLDTMRKTVNKEGLIPTSHAEEIFEDMLYDEYAQKMSRTANLGLDTMMYEQLKYGIGL